MRKGFTIMELVTIIGMVAVLTTIVVSVLGGRRSQLELDATTQQIATLLREAQGRALTQSQSVSWGVHFENATSLRPFYALFSGAYSTSTRSGYYPLPVGVGYVTSSIAAGGTKEIAFSQLTGLAVASDSVSLYLVNSNPVRSSTIAVSSSGAVSY